MSLVRRTSLPLLLGLWTGCEPQPVAPRNPTWADVEPILRGQCNHCHGGSAPLTGAIGPAVYRFDFYDMTPEVCGEAAEALGVAALAAPAAGLIKRDVTPPSGGGRPRMPPAPGEVLQDWERETLQRWADGPVKGAPPPGNLPPRIETRRFSATAGARLNFIAVLSDPEGQSAVGVVKVRDLVFKLDRPGSFEITADTSRWEPGPHKITAVVCDGWVNSAIEIGQVTVRR